MRGGDLSDAAREVAHEPRLLLVAVRARSTYVREARELPSPPSPRAPGRDR